MEDKPHFIKVTYAVCFFVVSILSELFHHVTLQLTVRQIKDEMEKSLQWLVPVATDTTKYDKFSDEHRVIFHLRFQLLCVLMK